MLYFDAVRMSSTSLACKSEPYTFSTSLAPKSEPEVDLCYISMPFAYSTSLACKSELYTTTTSLAPKSEPEVDLCCILCHLHVFHLPRMRQRDGGGSLSPSVNRH